MEKDIRVGDWVLRPNGKPAVVRDVRKIYGVWAFADEHLGTLVDVEWYSVKRGCVRRATHDADEVEVVPRA